MLCDLCGKEDEDVVQKIISYYAGRMNYIYMTANACEDCWIKIGEVYKNVTKAMRWHKFPEYWGGEDISDKLRDMKL